MAPTPFPFQITSIEFAQERSRAILAHEPGLGKSMMAILAADLPALVVCPASLILNWRREIELWRPEAAGDFSVLSYADRSIGTLSPEAIGRLYRTIIADEVHYLKNHEAKRSLHVCGMIGHARKAIALSGTIVPNRPIELWALMYAMGITDRSYYSFAYRYADAYKTYWKTLDVRGNSHIPELRDLLRPHLLKFTKEQVMPELPPKTWRVIALDLPRPLAEKGFSVDALSELEESIAFEALSDVLRLHGERKVPLALEHIENVLTSGKKVIVFGHHRDVIASLSAELAHARPVTLTGGMSAKRKQAAVDAFQRDSAVRVIVGQNTAMGTGHTLTASSHVVMVEGSWVPGDLEQMADRAHRIGQRDNVTVDVLTISGSIDEHMLRRALEKQIVANRIVPTTQMLPPALM